MSDRWLDVESSVTLEGKPFVLVAWGEQRGEMSPEEARYQAGCFLEVAEAAEQDAFFVCFCREKLGMDTGQILPLLLAFRAFREERRDGKRP